MLNYSDETYGERIADVYDQWYSEFDPDAIDFLMELANGGKVLELGVGTGRIALPLAKAGVAVEGLDASKSMVARLHSKPGGENIPVTIGSLPDIPVDGKFSLVYVVFNTFFCLLTQQEQIRCFQNVAGHLSANGVFVIEAFVPDMTLFTGGQCTRTIRIDDHEIQMDASQIEMHKQEITSQHVVLTEQGTRFYPVKLRYVWPSEMDLMAQLSHMRLRERWEGWTKKPFTARSGKHISIYELSSS
jgi:SAM-dependent methyltransferase